MHLYFGLCKNINEKNFHLLTGWAGIFADYRGEFGVDVKKAALWRP